MQKREKILVMMKAEGRSAKIETVSAGQILLLIYRLNDRKGL